ncbi:hypothetical protein BC834DRAFT_113298 [Gloeopeniophorella convolvens]|nr:hypothetical protein BC834DRAFT_113298 [Gloeopeniophorella convolvens]
MAPTVLALSTEILIEILILLPLRDVITCKLTCKRLHDVVAQSQQLQYVVQTMLAGAYDPLLPGPTIPERLEALHRLEDSWRDLNIQQRTARIAHGSAWPLLNYAIRDDYLLAVRTDSQVPNQPPGYSYIDLRQPLPYTDLPWTKIDAVWQDQHCVFAFAADEHDLAVVVTCARGEEISRAEVHCLSFISGDVHPLAADPNMVINFPKPSCPYKIYVQIMGEHILLSCNGSPNDDRQVDLSVLIKWKEGQVIPICHDPPPAMTYGVGAAQLSASHFAFVRIDQNAIILYKLADGTKPLQELRTLGLPPLCDGGRLGYAQSVSEQQPASPRSPSPYGRPPPRLPFVPNPDDAIVCFILGVGLQDIPAASMTVAIVTHRHALLALADAPASAERFVPWDRWGPAATRCLEVPHWRLCHGPTGQRWGKVVGESVVLRDFSPHRVRAAQLHPRADTRVVVAPTLLTAGLCFRDDVETRLPYAERTAPCPRRWERVLMDGERLLGLCLADGGDSAEIDVHVMGS